MFTDDHRADAANFLRQCEQKGLKLAAAESCTGGLVAALFTEVPGSSSVFERGYVTYSNISKTELLGVEPALIETHGAVSEQVAVAMAQGALMRANVDIAVAITGIAGPTGGTPQKPVGLVYIAVATKKETRVEFYYFEGGRAAIRLQSVAQALVMLQNALNSSFVFVA